MDRRRLLTGFGALSVLPLLSGCEDIIDAIGDSCPSDPADSGNITWIPDVAHPVFWGRQEVTRMEGTVSRTLRIYYPTHHGFTDAPPILKVCLHRWPVVVLLHGQPPIGLPTPDWYRKFELIAHVLARSGYVVVVPSHSADLPQDAGRVPEVMNDINFVRNVWADREWVDKRATSTAIMGHSFGALLGARVMAANPDFGAFVSLGGGWTNLNDAVALVQSITAPSFFMWGKGIDLILAFEDMDGNPKLWDPLTINKYAAVYEGEHFDYFSASDTGSARRGPCTLIAAVAADLAALFISHNVPVSASNTDIPIDLKPPTVNLTLEQEFYVGGHLNGIKQFDGRAGCRLDLRWNVNGVTGSRRLGP